MQGFRSTGDGLKILVSVVRFRPRPPNLHRSSARPTVFLFVLSMTSLATTSGPVQQTKAHSFAYIADQYEALN